MKRVFKYQITEEWESIREFLLDKRYPHAVFVKLKKTENSVLVNGEWLHLYQPLHIGDRLEIRLEENTGSENIVARSFEDIVKSLKAKGSLPMDETEKLPIVYEDEDILIVNKPAGLPIHPSQNHYDDSLARRNFCISVSQSLRSEYKWPDVNCKKYAQFGNSFSGCYIA